MSGDLLLGEGLDDFEMRMATTGKNDCLTSHSMTSRNLGI